jgi:small subunit ribosomal protein S19
MIRSKWKNPHIILLSKQNEVSRSTLITPKFIGSTFYVYNGNKYKEITVYDNMLGHKFGEFFFTRVRHVFKKKKKTKKK